VLELDFCVSGILICLFWSCVGVVRCVTGVVISLVALSVSCKNV